jgi:hypothetical protein
MPCLKGQKDLIKAEGKIVMYVGGLGAGKTRAAVYKAIQLGFLNAPCCGLFIEPSYTLVKDVAIESFKTILDELGIPYKIHLTNFVIRVADTFDILLRSGEEAERIIGVNAGWAIIDEPGKQDEIVGKNVLARVRDPRAKMHQIVLTGTPEGFNWFYEWSMRPDAVVIRAKTTDNPYLPKDYVATLSDKYSEEEISAYINGEFVRFEGGWYKVRPRTYKPIEVVDSVEIWKLPEQTSQQLVLGVDTGGGLLRDKTAVVLMDKRDKSLVATWTSNTATIDTAGDIVESLFNRYTFVSDSPLPGYVAPPPTRNPTVLVETNGIGETMWQVITLKKRLPTIKIKTTEANRYTHMLESKTAVEAGLVEGPSGLAEEADKLIVEDGKFKGPKDFSMAMGFCLKFIKENPYKAPEPNNRNVFKLRL